MNSGKKDKFIIITIMGIILLFASIYLYINFFSPNIVLQTNADTINCRQGNVLANVNFPSSIDVLSTCEKVIGVVHNNATVETDGDYIFYIKVDGPFKRLLSDNNIMKTNGLLPIEVSPIYQGSSSVQIPKSGDLVEVYGDWIKFRTLDLNEIDPAWKVRIL